MRSVTVLRLALGASTLAAGLMAASFPDPPNVSTPPPSAAAAKKGVAVLAGGCFWGMQGVFEHVKGVVDTEVGYSGGSKDTAHYERIEAGDTNHAESIRITYDPAKIGYGQLLKIYFSVAHDPTTLNRQHNDRGTQYRSSIFYIGDDQKAVAEAYIKELNDQHVFGDPVVTKVVPLTAFYRAEEYHQHYLDQVQACDAGAGSRCSELNAGYIRGADYPILAGFKRTYPELYSKESK